MNLSAKVMLGILFFAVSINAASIGVCSKAIQGGGDLFPWNAAEPFPWKKIQGVWKVQSNPDMLFQFKVNNPHKKSRRLLVQIYSRENCAEPLYKMPGVFDDREKNVMRMPFEDKLIKLAWFNTANLNLNPYQCGDFVMGASIIDSGVIELNRLMGLPADVVLPSTDSDSSTVENFFLKKLSNSLEIYCKKKI